MVGHVDRHHMGVAAAGFDLGAQGLQALDPAPCQHDAATCRRQRLRELHAQAARCAGDERDAAG